MPFAGYDSFRACVRDNDDKEDPEAYCAVIKEEVEAGASDEEAREAADALLTDGGTDTRRYLGVHTLELSAANTRPVSRHEESDGKVRYTNVMLLAPGEWTDAGSRTTLFYAPDAIERSVNNWVDRHGEPVAKAQLNHYHEPGQPASNVGHIPAESAYALEGCMYGDLVFHCRTQLSRDMEELMGLALETGGEEGLGGVSVEIPMDETTWDAERELYRMDEMWFSGVGVVMDPASVDVAFKTQLDGRVALSSGEFDVAVYSRTTPNQYIPKEYRDRILGREVKAGELRSLGMDDELDKRLARLEQRVLKTPYDEEAEAEEGEETPDEERDMETHGDEEGETVPEEAPEEEEAPEDPAEETEEDVPEDVALAAAALKEYMSSLEGVENPDMSLRAFMAWAESVDDIDDEVRGVVSMFLSETEADEDVPVTAFKEYLEDKVNPDRDAPVDENGEFDLAAYEETTKRLLSTIEALTERVEELGEEETPPRTMARGGASDNHRDAPDARADRDVSYGRTTVRDKTGYIGR